MSSSPSAAFALEHIAASPAEQLCYVHCNFCDTVLAVSVPCSSLFKTVTVRCGHCTNLLSVNMRGLLLQGANQLHLSQTFLAPTATHTTFMEQITRPPPPPLLVDRIAENVKGSTLVAPVKRVEEMVQAPVVNRPPEKRQRMPSAYNRFIKEEIQRIKSENPDITHREAFSAAAKNWAHFPHIHFGLLPDQGLKKNSVHQQEGDHDAMPRDGFYAAAANVGVMPF